MYKTWGQVGVLLLCRDAFMYSTAPTDWAQEEKERRKMCNTSSFRPLMLSLSYME